MRNQVTFFIILISAMASFFAISFIKFDINPANWQQIDRALVVLIFSIGFVLAMPVYWILKNE